MAWTDERVDILKRLWADGLSASEIAGRLGGTSRSAVIGKVHRLGFSGRSATKGYYRKERSYRRTHVSKPDKIALGDRRPRGSAGFIPDDRPPAMSEPYIPPSARKSLLELDEQRDCKWPIGDGPFTFCARRRESGLPYCKDHAAIAYRAPEPVRRQPTFAARSGRTGLPMHRLESAMVKEDA